MSKRGVDHVLVVPTMNVTVVAAVAHMEGGALVTTITMPDRVECPTPIRLNPDPARPQEGTPRIILMVKRMAVCIHTRRSFRRCSLFFS